MTQPASTATPNARHLDHDELAEWLKDLATLEPQNWRDILFRKAVKIQQALLETAMPAHLQDAPRTLRNAFDVTDPNDPKKTVKVVFASFAVCMEREANQLRSSVPSARVLLTDEQIMNAAITAADDLDATRVSEMVPGGWKATTIFEGDTGLLRFGRLLEKAINGK